MKFYLYWFLIVNVTFACRKKAPTNNLITGTDTATDTTTDTITVGSDETNEEPTTVVLLLTTRDNSLEIDNNSSLSVTLAPDNGTDITSISNGNITEITTTTTLKITTTSTTSKNPNSTTKKSDRPTTNNASCVTFHALILFAIPIMM